MNRQEAIEIIEALFPTDSPYSDTNAIGERLLAQARSEIQGWRSEPDEVLVRYADLCMQEENKQIVTLDLALKKGGMSSSR